MKVFERMHETAVKYAEKSHIFVGATRREQNFKTSWEMGMRVATALNEVAKSQKYIPIMSDFQPEVASILIGTWVSGRTAVPFGLNFAQRDLAEAMNICNEGYIFARYEALDRIQPHLSTYKGKFVIFDRGQRPLPESDRVISFESLIPQFSMFNNIQEPKPTDEPYILFSSGSTGRPKGIRQNYHMFAFQEEQLRKAVAFSKPELWFPGQLLPAKFMCYLSFGQTIGSYSLYCSFLAGSTFMSMNNVSFLDILNYVDELKPDSFFSVASILPLFLKEADRFKGSTASIKSWITGGTPLSHDKLEQFQKRFGKVMFGYGMTESVAVIAGENGLSPRRKGSVGRPIPDLECVIRDEKGQPVPTGTFGEVTFKSEAVSPGYYGMPKETAETFRDGWVYSGDIGHLDSDGYLYIVDRKKRMVIVGGAKIYPARVEEVLESLNMFSEVAAFGVPDESLGEALVVYYSAAQAITPQEIIKRVAGTLRTTEVPKYLIQIDRLPRTPATKVNFEELKKLFEEHRRAEATGGAA